MLRAPLAGLLAALAALLLPADPAGAQTHQALKAKLPGPAVARQLSEGGFVILMRHGATEKTVVDQDETFAIENCDTQRNLSLQGRAQSEAMGRAIDQLGIPIGEVLTSSYCRCVETARLAFGKATPSELMLPEGTISGHERGARIRKLLATAPPEGTNNVLVGHTAALLYSYGLAHVPEGITHVFRPQEFGPPIYVGFVTPDIWSQLAGAPPPADTITP